MSFTITLARPALMIKKKERVILSLSLGESKFAHGLQTDLRQAATCQSQFDHEIVTHIAAFGASVHIPLRLSMQLIGS